MRTGIASARILVIVCVVMLAVSWWHSRPAPRPVLPIGSRNFDAYVINLKSNPDRMKAFMRSYNGSDMSKTHSVIRHDAVNGRDLQLVEHVTDKALGEILSAERTGYRTQHYQLTRGGVGCYLSHVGLWRKVLDTDKEFAVIFEDDCVPALNILDIMRDSVPHTDSWDICLLGYWCNECDDRPDWGKDTIDMYRFFGLHAYMISRRGIEKFLADPRGTRISKQIDHVVCDMISEGAMKVIALENPVAWQNNAEHATTIQMPLREVIGIDPHE